LLPALPVSWRNGSITGLRARGGYEVDVTWKDGKLASATVRNVSGDGRCKVRLGDKVVELKVKRGKAITLNANLAVK
jgi:alpha-L-fucosidase 2